MPQPSGPRRRKTRSRHLVLLSRNYEYSAFTLKKDWSCYQSMSLEFRYDFGEVLGTQNFLTCRSASIYCVLCLNPIKGTFNICTLTRTHTSIHLSIQHGISSQILTYIYHSNQPILAYIYHGKQPYYHTIYHGKQLIQNKAASVHGRNTNMAKFK